MTADTTWTCHHCGSEPDPDGDHSCPCPHRDEDCPDHSRMTLADVTDARFTDDQRATLARFEAAPTPPEVQEARVVEEVARAMQDSCFNHGRCSWEHLAAAAVAAYRAQDGGAEEAHAGIVREASDLCWKATPFTEDETGAVAAYLLPAGVVHRLLGQLQGAGYPAAFRAIATIEGGTA